LMQHAGRLAGTHPSTLHCAQKGRDASLGKQHNRMCARADVCTCGVHKKHDTIRYLAPACRWLELRMYEQPFRDQPVNNPYDDFVFDNTT
jgi:hypothetical protein